EALKVATLCFESAEALVDVVKAKFRALPRIESIYDLVNIKLLQEEVQMVTSLSPDNKVINEALMKALNAMPRQMQLAFADATDDHSLNALNLFLKRRI